MPAKSGLAAVIPARFLFDSAAVDSSLETSAIATADFAEPVLRRITAQYCRVILDLSEIQLLTSAAMAVLVTLKTASKENAVQAVLANVSPDVMQVLGVCRANKLFSVFRSLDEALNSL